MEKSYFDGGVLSYIGNSILAFIIIAFTFGIATPWAMCIIYNWQIDHTVINGKRLKFSGSGIDLFGRFIIWLLLIIITFGIYSFWVAIKMQQWKVENTNFAE